MNSETYTAEPDGLSTVLVQYADTTAMLAGGEDAAMSGSVQISAGSDGALVMDS